MSLRARWQRFTRPPVGKRFQQRYIHGHSKLPSWFRKTANLLVGGVFVIAGLLMLFAPGPGVLVFVLGAALLAEEALWMARLLDACDLHGRRGLRALYARWHKAGIGLKILIVLGILALMSALAGLGLWLGMKLQ